MTDLERLSPDERIAAKRIAADLDLHVAEVVAVIIESQRGQERPDSMPDVYVRICDQFVALSSEGKGAGYAPV